MQKAFLDDPNASFVPSLPNACEYINYVADGFRFAQLPVLLIHDGESVQPDQAHYGFIDAIKQDPSDIVIHKQYGNAFRDTTLSETLQKLEINFLLFAGFKAEACVLATIHGAIDRDIPYAILKNGITSTTSDGATFIEKTFPLISYSVVDQLLLHR